MPEVKGRTLEEIDELVSISILSFLMSARAFSCISVVATERFFI